MASPEVPKSTCHDEATLNCNEANSEAKDNFLEKHGKKTKQMLRFAMEKVERKGRTTKQRLTTEFRNAMEGMEKQKQKTKEILTKATTEIMYAFEENDQKSQKRFNLKGGRVIPADGVALFKEPFAYNATCGSVLELLFFQKFWIWLSKKVPTWIMPCTITFFGLALNIVCCSILLHYSPDAKSEVPFWAFYLCSLSIFIYQTFDALDGKQSCKLQETQLEEMSDHGSDSLSTCFVTLTVGIAFQLGTYPNLMLAFCAINSILFYSAHWQTHITDIVVFRKIDVTEVQCAVMLIHLLTGMFGQEMWHYQVNWIGLDVRHIIVLISFVATGIAFLRNLKIIAGGKTPIDDITKIPRRQGLRILYPALPITLWSLLFLITGCSSKLFDDYPCFITIMYGFCFSKLLVKLQISNLGKTDCELLDWILLAPTMLCLNASLNIVPEHTALTSAVVFTLMDFLRYATYLCWDICEFQDIYVFTLKYPLGHPKNRAGARGIYLNGINNQQVIERLASKE